METVFRKGMKVYDSVSFPDSEGKVVDVEERIDCVRVIVQFDCLDYEIPYTERGIRASTRKESTPTLSTKPYTLQGFEQKAPAPTYEEAVEWLESTEGTNIMNDSVFLTEGNYYTNLNECTEALKKLIVLRDYYNKGWQPDWTKATVKYCIEVYGEDLSIIDFQFKLKPMAFKTREIRDKFLEEQKELLKIAKPLL